jgi:hypothetical protein
MDINKRVRNIQGLGLVRQLDSNIVYWAG